MALQLRWRLCATSLLSAQQQSRSLSKVQVAPFL